MMSIKVGYLPRVSPFGLIQESLFPDEWAILVACMMLNCTSRKQVEGVLPMFMKRWPTAKDLVVNGNHEDISTLIKPLGFAKRRADNLMKMSERYIAGPWTDVRELPGIGEYAGRSWDIFCRGIIGGSMPTDHALTNYWNWFKSL